MTAAAIAATPTPASVPPAHPVIELRQYKIMPGKRDAMIALFDLEFVESQEVLGATIYGQFRDLDDPDRFVWIRGFPNMAKRGEMLPAFYYGPAWQAHRDEANPLLDDNDNVLLLRPAAADLALPAPTGTRPEPGAARAADDVIVATIVYLWKTPDTDFTAWFHDSLAPALRKAGLPVLGGYVPEEAANNFPRLPVREHEKVFVWFTRARDRAAYDRAIASLGQSIRARLEAFDERPAQVLTLSPTPRSLLR
ncbi:MAG: NIPSNAP family protein [Sphingomonas sp.]